MTRRLSSQTLQFARDGRTLLCVEPAAVALVSLDREGVTAIPTEHAFAAIGFSDQVWIAAGRSPRLYRHALDGRLLDETALPPGGAQLVAAAVGAPAALWTSSPPLAFVEEAGALRTLPPANGDLAIPLTGRRWITAHGARVVVPSGLACDLASGARVTAGAIVLDGTSVLVLVELPQRRELVMIGLANAKITWRQTIPAGDVRVAARRGLALVVIDPHQFAVIDLRAGRLVGHGAARFAIADLAVDPDGRKIALRAESGELELVALAAALERRSESGVERVTAAVVATVADPELELVAPEAVIAPMAAKPPPSPVAWQRPFDLRALDPVQPTAPIAKDRALAVLDHEMRTVILRTLCAIAAAWDTRRIGYGNEGSHPFELEVTALIGLNRGFAKDHVAAAHELLAAHEASAPRQELRRGTGTSIGELAGELGLSALAVDIFLVVAAPALWSESARLYGILANDPGRALVDEALVEQILCARVTRHELAAELDPRAPLVRLGAIRIASGPRPFAGLSVDPILIARLRCEHPELGHGLDARGADRALEELALDAGVIPAALAALARVQGAARIALRGRPGSGRRTLLSALAAEAGRAVGLIDALVLPRELAHFAEALRVALRRAQLAGLLPCVVNLESVAFAERTGCEVAAEPLRVHPGPVALVLPAAASLPFDAGHVAIDLPVLSETARDAVWRTALSDVGVEVSDVAALAARYRVGPGLIQRAVAAALERRDHAGAAIDAFIRQTRDSRLGAHATRVERLATWDGLVLPPDVLDSLRELVSRVRHRRTVFETWGMDGAVATSRGLTALFQGQPGTGKTLVAGVIARELGLDLYRVDLSKVMSKWLGETERNLAAIFDAAEDGQVILLFDEADSLFAKRTEVRSSNDRYANLEVNFLLQRLDSFEGIAILTTNSGGTLDPALKRRMSFRLSFPFPDEDTREQLWRVHLPPELPVGGQLAFGKLAHKYQLSGGYIRNACLRAAFLAAQDETPLYQHHLERAVALEFAELGKLSGSGALD